LTDRDVSEFSSEREAAAEVIITGRM
jgi:hypothetical protein